MCWVPLSFMSVGDEVELFEVATATPRQYRDMHMLQLGAALAEAADNGATPRCCVLCHSTVVLLCDSKLRHQYCQNCCRSSTG